MLQQENNNTIANEILVVQNKQSGIARPRFLLTLTELANILGLTTNATTIAAQKVGASVYRVANRSAFSPVGVRSILESRGYQYKKEIIAFQMLKGGSTKTSSAFNLAVRLNQYGARVLCVDLDMQGNLTDAFDIQKDDFPVMYHVVCGEASIGETTINVGEGIDLIPSNFENSTLDFFITSQRKNMATFVRSVLEPVIHQYDYIIIDCNPALSSLNISIAMASDRIIIPVNPDKFSSKGLSKMIEEFARISEEHKHTINYNLLFTLFDGREASSNRYLIEYGSQYKDKLFSTVIKRNADVKNAIDQKKTIFDFPKASAREDFDIFARNLLDFSKIAKVNV